MVSPAVKQFIDARARLDTERAAFDEDRLRVEQKERLLDAQLGVLGQGQAELRDGHARHAKMVGDMEQYAKELKTHEEALGARQQLLDEREDALQKREKQCQERHIDLARREGEAQQRDNKLVQDEENYRIRMHRLKQIVEDYFNAQRK